MKRELTDKDFELAKKHAINRKPITEISVEMYGTTKKDKSASNRIRRALAVLYREAVQ